MTAEPTPSPPPAQKPAARAPAPSPDTEVHAFLSALPTSDAAFTRYDATFPPGGDAFEHYLPSAADGGAGMPIPTERTRCLIRALKAKPVSRKRGAAGPAAAAHPPKRRRWAALERERKQACLRVALAAACAGGGAQDVVLARLRRGWVENPRKKQLVNAEVRLALCRSLPRWSTAQLREYALRAGIERPDSRQELVRIVHSHLVPED